MSNATFGRELGLIETGKRSKKREKRERLNKSKINREIGKKQIRDKRKKKV
jgi:hypothetical protein